MRCWISVATRNKRTNEELTILRSAAKIKQRGLCGGWGFSDESCRASELPIGMFRAGAADGCAASAAANCWEDGSRLRGVEGAATEKARPRVRVHILRNAATEAVFAHFPVPISHPAILLSSDLDTFHGSWTADSRSSPLLPLAASLLFFASSAGTRSSQ